jgi:hypothetical protein
LAGALNPLNAGPDGGITMFATAPVPKPIDEPGTAAPVPNCTPGPINIAMVFFLVFRLYIFA